MIDHPCKGLPGLQGVGANTYLHCGAVKTGWPYDHSVEDTYEAPPFTWVDPMAGAPETDCGYYAEYNSKGAALLVLKTTTTITKIIANFDTMADADTAAQALNELKGY